MNRIKAILHSAGNSFAAAELSGCFAYDGEEDDASDYFLKPEEYFYKEMHCFSGNADSCLAVPRFEIDLSGKWRLFSAAVADGKYEAVDIEADVPGSIHTALTNAGLLADPYTGLHDAEAHRQSGREWIYEKNFLYDGVQEAVRLEMDGVCDRCEVRLNGNLLGKHQGMFGGPYCDITEFIKKGMNTLQVRLLPALNFCETVVFNCSDGWHYARLWPLGIWNNIRIKDMPDAVCEHPFISTYDSTSGIMELHIGVELRRGVYEDYFVRVIAAPKNFAGNSYYLEHDASPEGLLRFRLPDFKLWWPNGKGEQNLYTLYVQVVDKRSGDIVSENRQSFGVRTVSLAPFPSGEKKSMYNRVFVINGEGVFMKGAGWCTIDALMRFEKGNYEKILSRAKQQGINFLRAWGGGLVETEAFYELCDEYGICVYQEWPCCWDSQKLQPEDVLYETVKAGTVRIRNHPSLVLYGGGNEGLGAIDDIILNRIGRLTYQYDGTRAFYRQDGGISGKGMVHDHIHWGGEKPEHYVTKYALRNELNLHEYGLDSFMNISSVKKYASREEIFEWPVAERGTVAHHTATFNGEYGWNPTPHGFDVSTLIHYASMFIEVNDLTRLSVGSQLAQAAATALPIINARIKWPSSSVNIYYKLNDIYPGASWSVIDWYGSPKIAHYMCQDAQSPLMCAGLMDRYNTYDKEETCLNIPVYVLDDNCLLEGKDYTARVTLYDSALCPVLVREYGGHGFNGKSHLIGVFHADASCFASSPSFVTFELRAEKKLVSRYCVPLNYDIEQGSLFRLPHARLSMKKFEGQELLTAGAGEEYGFCMPQSAMYSEFGTDKSRMAVVVENISNVPALYVHFICRNGDDKFVCSDNYFCLEPGEKKLVYVNDYRYINDIGCLNYKGIDDELSLTHTEIADDAAIYITDAFSDNCDSVVLIWQCDAPGRVPMGYNIYIDGKKAASRLHETVCRDYNGAGEKYICECVITGLCESREYIIKVAAVDCNFIEFTASGEISVSVLPDRTPPEVLGAYVSGKNEICILFSKNIDADSASDCSNYEVDGLHLISARLSEENPRKVALRAADSVSGRSCVVKVNNVVDTAKLRNRAVNTSVPVLEVIEDGDFSRESDGRLLIDNTVFGVEAGAVISFKLQNDGTERYRVLIAKCTKGEAGHFEIYLRPDGDMCIFSRRGDFSLGIKLEENMTCEISDITVKIINNSVTAFLNGEEKMRLPDAVSAEDICGKLSIGALNDGGLPFNGMIKDIKIRTWCTE